MSYETDVYKKIRRLQIVSKQLANDVLAGAYQSAFKGKGIEFEEVREYQPGDEIRAIDWNVTARLGTPYVKNFKEERALTVMLVVDVSASTHFGSVSSLKQDIIAEIGALLAFAAIQNGDKIGLILFSDQVEKYIPPNKGVKHVLRIIRELLVFKSLSKGTNVAGALTFLAKVQRKRGICFLISDFICDDYQHAASLLAKAHDLISICLTDPIEKQFPANGLMTLRDLESDESKMIATDSKKFNEQLHQLTADRIAFHQKFMKKIGADFIDINTEVPYLQTLRQFFKKRKERR